MFAVCPGKGGIIVKTTGITGGGDGFPLGDLISCQQKALRVQKFFGIPIFTELQQWKFCQRQILVG